MRRRFHERAHGCGFCNPMPGEFDARDPLRPDPPAEPDPTCPECAVRDWVLYPATELLPDEWRVVGGLIDLRCGGRCEGCGIELNVWEGINVNLHHRRAKGMGGTSDLAIHGLANLLALCVRGSRKLGGSAPGCHSQINADGDRDRARGLVVPQGGYTGGLGEEPPEVSTPLILPSGRRVLLDPLTGRYLAAPGRAYAVVA